MTDKALCSVCGKVVRAKHGGVHPACRATDTLRMKRREPLPDVGPTIVPVRHPERDVFSPLGINLSQRDRDRILRAVNGAPRPRR